MGKVTSAVIGGLLSLGMSFEAQASTAVNEAYAQCKTEVQAKFGEDTRVKMKGSKKYKGALTIKLSVVPEGADRQRLQCKLSDGSLVLLDKAGTPIS